MHSQSATQGSANLLNMNAGGVMVVWYDARSSNRQIYAQRLDWKGTALFTAGGKPVSSPTLDAQTCVLCSDGYGGAFIAYRNYGNTDRIMAVRINGSGKAYWDSTTIAVVCDTTMTRNFYAGSMALAEPGRAVLSWYDYRFAVTVVDSTRIYAQTIDASGNLLWQPNGVPVSTARHGKVTPMMVPTNYRSVIIAWKDNRSTSSPYIDAFDVYAQRLNAFGGLTGVQATDATPEQYSLEQNYPNPFNPSTVITYQLPGTAPVRLRVFDLLGREVALLVNEQQSPGSHSVRFDGTELASGFYLYRLEAGTFVQSKKMIHLK
jgi:hypothetical protein